MFARLPDQTMLSAVSAGAHCPEFKAAESGLFEVPENPWLLIETDFLFALQCI